MNTLTEFLRRLIPGQGATWSEEEVQDAHDFLDRMEGRLDEMKETEESKILEGEYQDGEYDRDRVEPNLSPEPATEERPYVPPTVGPTSGTSSSASQGTPGNGGSGDSPA